MKYLIVDPLMLMESKEMVSRPFCVILTRYRAVFICGDTEAMEPFMIVPFLSSTVTVSFIHFIKNRTSFMAAVVLTRREEV